MDAILVGKCKVKLILIIKFEMHQTKENKLILVNQLFHKTPRYKRVGNRRLINLIPNLYLLH